MAKETKEERRLRIQKEVADESAARREAYFKAQEESKAKAAAAAPPLPKPDAYVYDYAWRQGVGTPEGQLKLIKSPNAYYDASTNTIVDPATGERTDATQSMVSGASTSSDSLYASKYAAGYGMDTQGNQYRGAGTQGDPLTINGSPFTGTWQGKTYQNGLIKTSTTSSVTTQPIISTGLDSATLELIKSLQTQIANLTTGNAATAAATKAAEKLAERQSAFDVLRAEMDALGLAALVEPLRGLIQKDVSPSEFAVELRQSEAYKNRFIANEGRLKKGLRVLTPGEYLRVEDAYRQTLRTYGLKQFDNIALKFRLNLNWLKEYPVGYSNQRSVWLLNQVGLVSATAKLVVVDAVDLLLWVNNLRVVKCNVVVVEHIVSYLNLTVKLSWNTNNLSLHRAMLELVVLGVYV